MSMWSAGKKKLSQEQVDSDAENAKKDLKLVSQSANQTLSTNQGPISWNPLRHNSVLTSTVKRRIYFMESVSKTYRLAEKFSANPDCFLLTRCQDTYKMAIGCRSRHYRGRLTFIEAKFYSLEF